MLISSMIIKVLPAKAEETVSQLEKIPAVTSYGIHKENNIILVAERDTIEELEQLTRDLMQEHDAILGVFPTYVGSDDVPVNA